MKPWAELCSRGVRSFFSGVFSFALWTVWLALVVLLGLQIYILSANELTLPNFVLRQLEARLAESGLRASFSRTSFDPSGQLVIEDVRLAPPAFEEPVVTARSIYVRLNPWWLTVGQVELREIRFHDVTASVPALFSPSGRPEKIVTDLVATLEPSRKEILFRQFSGRVAGITVSAHGRLMLGAGGGSRAPLTETLRDFVDRRFATVCRQALALAQQAAQFEEPAVHLEFARSESGATAIQLSVLARAVRLTTPVALEATGVTASTRFLLFGDAPASDIEVSATELKAPGEVVARGVHARLLGRIRLEGSQFDSRELAVTADSIQVRDFETTAVSARVFSKGLPRFETRALAQVLGAPLAIDADADFDARHGSARFEGRLSPRLLDVVQQRTGANVRRFFDFETLVAERGEVRFGDAWKFEKLTARVRIPKVDAYGVAMQDARVSLELDPRRFYAPEAFARVGENFARGSYEHDLTTFEYRFLLDGQLRPLDISRWFREWWPGFFRQLDFRSVPPSASVDVRSSWRDGRQSRVFVFADAPRTAFRDLEFDRVRTRLFIRPAFFDGLEAFLTRANGTASGRFTYIANPVTNEWRNLELGVASTLELKDIAQFIGPAAAKTLAPFRVSAPPTLAISGQFAGSDPGAAATQLKIEARTAGDFRFHEFPLKDVAFVATVDRDDILLDRVSGRFADGTFAGHARVWGAASQRRVGFDFSLEEASLGRVAGDVGDFIALQKGQPATPPGKFVQEKANVRLNLAASAEGSYDNILSYRGDGNAFLHGAGLGEVPLLGALSELLKFTSLRFTEARSNFKIDGSRLVFPAVTIRGANSSVDAHGSYALDQSTLDFNAKIFPFQESENLLKTVVGAVLSPISNVFEVKLTGSPTKPNWSLVLAPPNFLRALTGGAETGVKTEPASGEKSPAPTPSIGEKPVNPANP